MKSNERVKIAIYQVIGRRTLYAGSFYVRGDPKSVLRKCRKALASRRQSNDKGL